jgi:hypothetical protein
LFSHSAVSLLNHKKNNRNDALLVDLHGVDSSSSSVSQPESTYNISVAVLILSECQQRHRKSIHSHSPACSSNVHEQFVCNAKQ